MDLGCSFSDRAKFCVSIEFLHWKILGVTVAPVYLEGLIGHFHPNFRGVHFGHGADLYDLFSFILHACRFVQHELRGLNFGGHVRQFECNSLEFAYRPSKLFPFPGIFQSGLIGPFGYAKR